MAILKRLTGKEVLNSIGEQSAVKIDGWRSYIRLLRACLNTTTIILYRRDFLGGRPWHW